MVSPKYSIIIPVFNRPEEVEELLESLSKQSFTNFEVLIIEDGSTKRSEAVFEKYAGRLSIQYFFKPNTGPGPSRNFGFEKARGNYFVVVDSDCTLPPEYFEMVDKHLASKPLDAWGGPDRGHEKFSSLQRAMAYTMSSFLTTGGIRGGKNKSGSFQPRSFNMGMSRKVWEKTGGFKFDRLAEDIELSIRIRKAGFKVGLIPEAFVFHKRRAELYEFFRQVEGFGKGRVRVGKVHPGEIRIAHWFPSLMLLAYLALPIVIVTNRPAGMVLGITLIAYSFLIFLGCIVETRSWTTALLSVPSAVVQLVGYGYGFISEKVRK